MVKQLSVGSEWIWLDTSDPGLSETSVFVGNWWLNTATNALFSCKDATFGAQTWDEYAPAQSTVVQIDGDSGSALPVLGIVVIDGGTTGLTTTAATDTVSLTGTLVVANGGTGATTLTGVLTGNGTSAITGNAITQYGTLIAGASNAVSSVAPSATSGVPLISQGAASNPVYGTVVVEGGGTGATTLTDHGVLVGSGTSAIDALSVGATGTVLVGVTGADPEFTATPSVTSIAIGSGALTITSGAGAPGSSQPKGSLYLRTDGGGVNDRMYVATDGVGTWTAVVTVA